MGKAQVMKANIVVTTKNAPAKTKAGVAVNVEDGREETFAHVNQEAMQKETQRVVHLKSRSSQQTMTLQPFKPELIISYLNNLFSKLSFFPIITIICSLTPFDDDLELVCSGVHLIHL